MRSELNDISMLFSWMAMGCNFMYIHWCIRTILRSALLLYITLYSSRDHIKLIIHDNNA